MTTDATNAVWSPEGAVSHMASLLRGRGVLTAGDVAALRRMDPRRPPAAFFKLEGLVLDGHLPGTAAVLQDLETRWAVVAQGLAHLGPLHRPGQANRLGLALAAAGYAEVRFARLVAADASRLTDEIPSLARYLAAKNIPVDWTGAAHLMLSAGRADEESHRRHVARDYYGLLARQEQH